MNTKAQNGRVTAIRCSNTLFLIGDMNKIILQMPWNEATKILNNVNNKRLIAILSKNRG